MKQFACGAVIPDCSAIFHAETEDEIVGQVAVHAREDHGISGLSPEVERKVRAHVVHA